VLIFGTILFLFFNTTAASFFRFFVFLFCSVLGSCPVIG
jgi:hypothetical protein